MTEIEHHADVGAVDLLHHAHGVRRLRDPVAGGIAGGAGAGDPQAPSPGAGRPAVVGVG